MGKKGKKYLEAVKLVDRHGSYSLKEAVELLKKTHTANFDETVELHFRLGVDSRHADQQVRGTVVLPHGTGKSVRVAVFAKGPKAEEAKEAGADFAGEDLVDKVQNEGWFDFDVAIATPDMMGQMGKLGRVLGPRGLMPNPKAGTVTMDVKKAISEVKSGKVEYRTDKQNLVHVLAGKISFTEDQLFDNLSTIIGAVVKAKPASSKGKYLKSVTVANTMGPGIPLDTTALMEIGKA